MADLNEVLKLQSVDDQLYYFDITIYNQFDDQDPFKVPYLIVDELAIEENLSDFNRKGYITLNINHDILEKYYPDKQDKAPFIFRTDGRNRIRLTVRPVFDTQQGGVDLWESTGSNVGEQVQDDEALREKWEIDLDAVIYDVEDLDAQSVKNKRRRFYFHDERYQIFCEKNIDWSTAVEGRTEEGLSPAVASTSDAGRCCKSTYALKSLIHEAGKNPDTKDEIKVGGGTIDNPKYPIQCSPTRWKLGSDDTNIFYTSPSYSTVIEDINYVLNFCVDKDEGPMFLNLARWDNKSDKWFELKTLKSYFDDAEDEQVEHLIIEDGIFEAGGTISATSDLLGGTSGDIVEGKDNKLPYEPKAPNEESSELKNFTSRRASNIRSYKFAQMVAADDARLCTTPLHQFIFESGEFKINFTNNKIMDLKDKMESIVKTGLYSFQKEENEPHLLMNINQTKQKNIMLRNQFESLQFIPTFLPQSNMLRDMLFLNQCISFIVTGLTIRQPGKFLFIDKFTSTGTTDPFDNRFLGQWMILKVVHLFKQGTYDTEIVATKVDSFRKIWDVEDTKY